MNTSIQERIKNDKILSVISKNFPDLEIYVVGGTVRDFLMDKNSYDRDIVVNVKNLKQFAEKLNKIIPSTLITLDEKNNIYRLIL